MFKTLATTTLALGLTFIAMQDANAWTRHSSVTGSGGRTAIYSGAGNCAGHTCTSSGTWTGPNGYTATRNRAVTCANGTCVSSGSITGIYGRSITRSGSISRY